MGPGHGKPCRRVILEITEAVGLGYDGTVVHAVHGLDLTDVVLKVNKNLCHCK